MLWCDSTLVVPSSLTGEACRLANSCDLGLRGGDRVLPGRTSHWRIAVFAVKALSIAWTTLFFNSVCWLEALALFAGSQLWASYIYLDFERLFPGAFEQPPGTSSCRRWD